MGAQGVGRHQLLGHLPGHRFGDAAFDVDAGEFFAFGVRTGDEFPVLAGKIGPLGVGL